MEAPGGQDVGSVLDRAGDFSPRLVRFAARPRGGVPAVRSGPPEAPSGTSTLRRPTRRALRHRPADASRSTAPAARRGRRPDVLPCDRARTSMRAAWRG